MSSESPDQYKGQRVGLFIFDCFMSVMYLVLSIALLFTSFLKTQIPGSLKTGLGVVLGLYGIYRVARATKRIMQRNR